MSTTVSAGPYCGAYGCRDGAVFAVDHPDHGELVACAEHGEPYEVIRRV